MKKINIFAVVLLLALGSVWMVKAQSGNPLPLLEEGVDARAVAMGNFGLLSSDRNHLYTNPTSLFDSEKVKLHATISGTLTPSMQGATGRLVHGVASIGYRFLDRHALLVGARYRGGLLFDSYGGPFGDLGRSRRISPFAYTVDLGYAFRFTGHWGAFATASFFQNYTGRSLFGGFGALGATYRTCFGLSGGMLGLLNIAAKVADLGMPLYYSRAEGFALPSKAELAADFRLVASERMEATVALGGRYFLLPMASRSLQVNLGAEVKGYKLVALRAGVQCSPSDYSFLALGGGLEYCGVQLDVALLRALDQDYRFSDRLVGTLSYSF